MEGTKFVMATGEYILNLDPYNFETEEEYIKFYHSELLEINSTNVSISERKKNNEKFTHKT